MRILATSILTGLMASVVMAQLTPGVVVRSGEPFPIVADFNGDGLDDLVQERTVILNNAGDLSEQRDLGLPNSERVVGVLDVNGDRIPDLLTLSSTSAAPPPTVDSSVSGQWPRYRLYIANASRKYSKAIDVSTGAHPYVVDADGDGKDDFLLLNEVREGVRAVATEVTVLRSGGDGTFERLAPFRIPPAAQIDPEYRALSADLDHDGRPDVVIRCTHDLVVLHGTGGGNFTVEDRYLPMNMEFGWWSTRLADVDGDSNPDVILAGFRNIRVLFGDGRGNFTRMTKATIAKLHDANLPAGLPDLGLDRMNQPRNLAVGHFTRGDQMQIAAGMGEGDIVVFSYERGQLKETARTATDFWLLDIRPGHFRTSTVSDVYAMGTLIWGDVYPRPRVFQGVAGITTADTSARATGRSRVSHATAPEISLQAQLRGDCIDAATERWKFARSGMFGSAQQGSTTVEALFDGSQIYARLSAAYSKEPIETLLSLTPDGSYSGAADVLTSCGWSVMTITAKAD
jgi:hypothetical protein